MNALCVSLNFATFLAFVIGTGVASILSSLLFVPVFAVCILMGYCSYSIQQQSNVAAKCGVTFMLLLVIVGLFFPLVIAAKFGMSLMLMLTFTGVFVPLGLVGLVGLVGAYRNRNKWTAW